jgi:hypothetical protein
MSAITDVKRPIEGLDVTQLRQEAAERFTKQEAIYAAGKQAGMLTDEQQAEFRRLGEEIDQFEAVLTKKESFGEFSARHQSIADDRRKKYLTPAEQMRHADPQEDRLLDQRGAKRRSPGQQFIDADGYQELLKRGAFHGELPPPEFGITLDQRDIGFLEQRALLQGGSATSGGGFVTPDYQPGFVDIRQRMLTVLDLITRIPTNSTRSPTSARMCSPTRRVHRRGDRDHRHQRQQARIRAPVQPADGDGQDAGALDSGHEPHARRRAGHPGRDRRPPAPGPRPGAGVADPQRATARART